jgi:hypothetical protein
MKHSDSATEFITRRDFMKKSALTVGAITLLSQGIGLASGTGGGSSYYLKANTKSDVWVPQQLLKTALNNNYIPMLSVDVKPANGTGPNVTIDFHGELLLDEDTDNKYAAVTPVITSETSLICTLPDVRVKSMSASISPEGNTPATQDAISFELPYLTGILEMPREPEVHEAAWEWIRAKSPPSAFLAEIESIVSVQIIHADSIGVEHTSVTIFLESRSIWRVTFRDGDLEIIPPPTDPEQDWSFWQTFQESSMVKEVGVDVLP